MADEPRRPLVAGNWRMNLNHYEANGLVQKLAHTLTEKDLTAVEVVVLPPFTDIRTVQTAVDGDKWLIGYGAQDLSAHVAGAYTGEVSGTMLARLGCSYAIVGHSERRAHHQESDELVNAKARAALANGIAPILCVGDTQEARDSGESVKAVLTQLDAGLAGITGEQVERVVVVYEPIWANEAYAARPKAGDPEGATPEAAQEMIAAIRARIGQSHSTAVARNVRILYGGPVRSATIAAFVDQPDIDGALVGAPSLDADEFVKICRFGEKA